MTRRACLRSLAVLVSAGLAWAVGPAAADAAPDAVTSSIGNLVWRDFGCAGAGNGRYDPARSGDPCGEEGADGVVVELLSPTSGVLGTQTTDLQGYYRFDGIAPGTYLVRLAARNFAPGGPLHGEQSTPGISSTDLTRAGNFLDHGQEVGDPAEVGVTSGPVRVGTAEPLDDLASTEYSASHGPSGDAHDNLVVDFGLGPRIDYSVALTDLTPGRHPVQTTVTEQVTVSQLGPGTDPDGRYSVQLRYPNGWHLLGETDDVPCFGTQEGLPYPPTFFDSYTECEASADPPPRGAGFVMTFRLEFVVESVPPAGSVLSAHVSSSLWDVDAGNDTASLDVTDHDVLAISSRVWRDDDADGVRDAGDPPLDGIQVELLDDDFVQARHVNGDPVAPAVSSRGRIVFDDLPPGTYQLRIRHDAASGLRGYWFTAADQGPDFDHGSAVGYGSTSGIFFLTATDGRARPATRADHVHAEYVDVTRNVGLQPVFALGNRVWDDQDEDGRQDAGEPSVAGARIEILDPSTGRFAHRANGSTVAPIRTGANGYWVVTGLARGRYKIRVTDVRLCSGTAPSSCQDYSTGSRLFRFSPSRAPSATSATNSDVDAAGRSGSVYLALGGRDLVPADPAELDAIAKNSTVDAGLVFLFTGTDRRLVPR